MSQVTTTQPPTVGAGSEPERDRPRSNPVAGLVGSGMFQSSISFVAFAAVFAGYALWLGSSFTSVQARLLDVHQNAPVLILALAVMVTLIAGKFDLSVGGMATLTTFLVIGLKINQNWPFALVVALCLAIGLVGGLINGILVVRLRVNTFIATLATGGIFGGFGSVYGKGTQLSPTPGSKGQLPTWFTNFGSFGHKFPSWLVWIGLIAVAGWAFVALRARRPASRDQRAWDVFSAAVVVIVALLALFVVNISTWVNTVSWTIGVLLVIGLGVWVLLGHTTFGRFLHATGSNGEAARLAGVNPGKETIRAFVIGGLLAAVAGILLAANQGSASPDVATGYLLPAFAAAFLSTVVLSNGRFTVWGALIGGTFLVWVSQGLIIGGLAFTWTDVVNGIVLVAAVAISTVFFNRRVT